MKASDEAARLNAPIASPPDLWRVFLEPPVPAAGQQLAEAAMQREPETHYGTLAELTAIAAEYGVEEAYVWIASEKSYRLAT